MAKPDPTKDPKIQRVVQAFLWTPLKPRKPLGKLSGRKRSGGKVQVS
jgi:hypothetical protein